MSDILNKREAAGIVATMRLATLAGVDVRQMLILFAVATASPNHPNASEISAITGIPRETARRMLMELAERAFLVQIADESYIRWAVAKSAKELIERVLQGMPAPTPCAESGSAASGAHQ